MIVFCVFCFFKQKTAYEMRISDWSSDVCSSDLVRGDNASSLLGQVMEGKAILAFAQAEAGASLETVSVSTRATPRSEERRVGKERVSPCRSRGSPPPSHKQHPPPTAPPPPPPTPPPPPPPHHPPPHTPPP